MSEWKSFGSLAEFSDRPFVKEIDGVPLVGFLGPDGPVAMYAYCAHLGANLGVTSRVRKGRLRCPFHGWEFASNGNLEEIPHHCGKLPKVRQPTFEAKVEEEHCWVRIDPAWNPPTRHEDVNFPMGWYQVGRVSDLANEDTIPKKWFGRSFGLTRSDDRFLLRPTESIVQPVFTERDGIRVLNGFAWQHESFMPSDSPTHELVEHNELLFAWFHPNGGAPQTPFPKARFRALPKAVTRASRDLYIKVRFQDVCENVADTQHFAGLHKLAAPARIVDIVEDNWHFDLAFVLVYKLGGVVPLHLDYQTNVFGPGVYETIAPLSGLIPSREKHFINFACSTPIDKNEMALQWNFFFPKTPLPGVNGFAARTIVSQHETFFAQDGPVLENKMRRTKDLLLPSDAPLKRFRRWFARF